MDKRVNSLNTMSKKKSSKDNSVDVNEVKAVDVKRDEVKVDALKGKGIEDSPATQVPAVETSASQKGVSPKKAVSPKSGGTKQADTKQVNTPKAKRGFPILGVVNLLLIIGLMAAVFYYWQMQQKNESDKLTLLFELRAQIDKKADLEQVQAQTNAQFSQLKSGIGSSKSRIDELQQEQRVLKDSTEKLFDLYGRSDSDWQLSEVAYLLRIAQHKLALENDFEGAALTLQAASDKIATTADPGLLPVRVLISEEIAGLKTRARPDLVGMTLLLSQLSQQIQTLKPGYQPAIKDISMTQPTELAPVDATIEQKVTSFFTSLVTVKRSTAEPTNTEALIVNIKEIMDSNLKLTRWTVLERDDFQYRQLMLENIRLFKQYYNLDNAANNDFYVQLLQLKKSVIKPTKPAINGSLQLLNNIISQRQNAPDVNSISPPKVVTEPESSDAVNEAADNV